MPTTFGYTCRDCQLSFGEATIDYVEGPPLLSDDLREWQQRDAAMARETEAARKAVKAAYAAHMREVHGIRIR